MPQNGLDSGPLNNPVNPIRIYPSPYSLDFNVRKGFSHSPMLRANPIVRSPAPSNLNHASKHFNTLKLPANRDPW